MRIGIDGGCWSNRRGFGRFLRELLHALARQEEQHEYAVVLDRRAAAEFHLGSPFRKVVAPIREGVADAARSDGRRSLGDLARMAWAARREPVDAFFFPAVYSYFPLLRRTRVLLGIHDAIADRNPHRSFSSAANRRNWRWKNSLALAQADLVVTVSRYSQRCIEETYGVASGRIRVLPEAASPTFRPCPSPEGARPYILNAGGLSPNKNLAALIRAFHRLKARRDGIRLVLVGNDSNDPFFSHAAELKKLVADLALEREVDFPGFVPDEDLVRFYSGAAVFAMPSLDEGFGLPLLEAMACGAPVIVSRGNALEEVAGDAAVLADPDSVESIAAALDRVLADGELRREMRQASLRRAGMFSWDKSASRMLDIFREVQ